MVGRRIRWQRSIHSRRNCRRERLPKRVSVTLEDESGGNTVPNSLCRLTVQCDADNAVDVALPMDVPVYELLPSLVDTAVGSGVADACRWHLSRVSAGALDDSRSLRANHIRDGEVLLLTVDEPAAPQWVVLDPSRTVAQAGNADLGVTQRVLPRICGVFMALISIVTLVWSATTAALIIGAIVAAASAAAAIVTRRVEVDAWPCVSLAVVSVLFTAVVGFLVVPTGSVAAHTLLSSAAAFSAATALARLVRCGTGCFTAMSVVTLLLTVVAAVAVVWSWHAEAYGAALAALSLMALAAAPRIAIVLAGIRPADDVTTARAVVAHQMLTGLVAGASTGGAVGATVAALGGSSPTLARVVFAAVVGMAMMLRARTYADGSRCITLLIGGLLSVAVGVAVAAAAQREHAHWIGVLAAAAGAVVLSPLFRSTANPLARRAVEMLDYVGLAAVVPAACWVGGLFGFARTVSLI
jgi:type VII secretion integral membrane protein EccD